MTSTSIELFQHGPFGLQLFDTVIIQHHGPAPQLPQYLDDDRSHQQWVNTYTLQGVAHSPNGNETAQYIPYTPKPGDLRIGISYLMSSPWGQSIVAYAGSQAIVTSPVNITFSSPFDPMDIPIVEATQYGGWVPLTGEPECRCDIRQLMSSGHDSGCSYIIWKRNKRA